MLSPIFNGQPPRDTIYDPSNNRLHQARRWTPHSITHDIPLAINTYKKEWPQPKPTRVLLFRLWPRHHIFPTIFHSTYTKRHTTKPNRNLQTSSFTTSQASRPRIIISWLDWEPCVIYYHKSWQTQFNPTVTYPHFIYSCTSRYTQFSSQNITKELSSIFLKIVKVLFVYEVGQCYNILPSA